MNTKDPENDMVKMFWGKNNPAKLLFVTTIQNVAVGDCNFDLFIKGSPDLCWEVCFYWE